MEIGEVFFWIATIINWQHLLREDRFKEVIIQSLSTLSVRGLAEIFVFVIMPNYIHLFWRTNVLNGKETVQASFLKFTAHAFKKMLSGNDAELSKYVAGAHNKKYEFWQRDSLAVDLYSMQVMLQKLNYIHLNLLAINWNLASNPWDYYYLPARYYEMHEKNFDFLKHVREEF